MDLSELPARWTLTERAIPPPYRLCGVVYHGPSHEPRWVAFLCKADTDEPGGPEGAGESPIEALEDLVRAVASPDGKADGWEERMDRVGCPLFGTGFLVLGLIALYAVAMRGRLRPSS